MEELLKQFMDQMNSRFDNLENRFDNLESRFDKLENRFNGLEKEVCSLKGEQTEMRKEIAFYYGSLMKEHENSRTEMRSNFNYLDQSIKRHQDVIESLNSRLNH